MTYYLRMVRSDDAAHMALGSDPETALDLATTVIADHQDWSVTTIQPDEAVAPTAWLLKRGGESLLIELVNGADLSPYAGRAKDRPAPTHRSLLTRFMEKHHARKS